MTKTETCIVPRPESIYYVYVVSPNKDLVHSITNEEPIAFEYVYGVRPQPHIHNQSVVRFHYQYSISAFNILIDVVNELRQKGMSLWIHTENNCGKKYYPYHIWDKHVLIRHDNYGFCNMTDPLFIVLELVSTTDTVVEQMNSVLNCFPKHLSYLAIDKYNKEFSRS
jgi:hypothetical protein